MENMENMAGVSINNNTWLSSINLALISKLLLLGSERLVVDNYA